MAKTTDKLPSRKVSTKLGSSSPGSDAVPSTGRAAKTTDTLPSRKVSTKLGAPTSGSGVVPAAGRAAVSGARGSSSGDGRSFGQQFFDAIGDIKEGIVYLGKGAVDTAAGLAVDTYQVLGALAPGGWTIEDTDVYKRNNEALDLMGRYYFADTSEEEREEISEELRSRAYEGSPLLTATVEGVGEGVLQIPALPAAAAAAVADWTGNDEWAEDVRAWGDEYLGGKVRQWQEAPIDTGANALATAAMGVGAVGRALGSGRLAQAAATAGRAEARAAAAANRASRRAARLSGAAEAADEAGNAARAARLAGKAQKVAEGGKARAAKILAEGEEAAKFLDAAKSTRRGQWAWKLRHISGQMNRYDPMNLTIEGSMRGLAKLLSRYGAKRVAAGKRPVPGAAQVTAALRWIGNTLESFGIEADATAELSRFGEVEASVLLRAVDDYLRVLTKKGNRDLDASAALVAHGHLDAMRAAMPDFERVFSHPDSIELFGPELERRLQNWWGANAANLPKHQRPTLEHLRLAVEYRNGGLTPEQRAVVDMSLEGRRVIAALSGQARRQGRGVLAVDMVDDFEAGRVLERIREGMDDPQGALGRAAKEVVFDRVGSDAPAESMLFDLADSEIPAQYKPALRGAARDIQAMRAEVAKANGGKVTAAMELTFQEGAANVVEALMFADEVVFTHGGIASTGWLDTPRLEDTSSVRGNAPDPRVADFGKTAALTPLTFDQAVEFALRAAHRRSVNQAIVSVVRRVGRIVPDEDGSLAAARILEEQRGGQRAGMEHLRTELVDPDMQPRIDEAMGLHRQLEAEGLVRLDFIDEAAGEMWVPKHLYKPIKRVFDAPPPGAIEKAGRFYDKTIGGPWKTIVLATSGMWHQANLVSNIILLNVSGGVRISEIIGSLGDAYRLRQHVQANPFENPQLTATLSGGFFGTVRRERLARSGARPQRTAFRVPDVPVLRSVFGGDRRTLLDHSFALNEFIDSMARAVTYIDSKKKGMSSAEALRRAQRSIGDYDRLTRSGRWMVRIKPFWRWVRTITKLALKLPVEHPFRTAWLLSLHDRFADDAPEGVPDYYRGNYFDPERGLMWNTGQMIPEYESTFDLKNLVLGGNSPLIDIGYLMLTDGKTLTGDFEARFPPGKDINRLGMLREAAANTTFLTRLLNNPTGEKRYSDGTAIPGQYIEYGGWAEDLPYAASAIAQQLGLRPPRDIGVDTIRRWEAEARREREKRRREALAKNR